MVCGYTTIMVPDVVVFLAKIVHCVAMVCKGWDTYGIDIQFFLGIDMRC